MESEKMTYCPFNPNHIISKRKLYDHLNRCRDKKKSNMKLFHCKKNFSNMFVGETNWQNHINRCIHCNPNLNFTYEMSEEVLKDPIEVIDLTQEDKSQEESIIHLGNEMEKIIFDDSSKVSKSSAKKHSFM